MTCVVTTTRLVHQAPGTQLETLSLPSGTRGSHKTSGQAGLQGGLLTSAGLWGACAWLTTTLPPVAFPGHDVGHVPEPVCAEICAFVTSRARGPFPGQSRELASHSRSVRARRIWHSTQGAFSTGEGRMCNIPGRPDTTLSRWEKQAWTTAIPNPLSPGPGTPGPVCSRRAC